MQSLHPRLFSRNAVIASLMILLPACAGSTVHEPDLAGNSLAGLGEQPVVHGLGACELCDVYHDALSYVVRVQAGSTIGAGVVVSRNGLIATNAHVVKGTSNVQVILHDGVVYQAKVVRHDAVQDLALIQVEVPGLQWTPVNLEHQDLPRVGSEVYVIGHPFGLGWTVSRGIVSAYRKPGEISPVNFVQTDAAISPGNSGGPLLDSKGNLLGIITSKLVGQEVDNVAFARPTSALLRLMDKE